MNKKCLVFGSTGVISKVLIKTLIEQKFTVYGVSRNQKRNIYGKNYHHISFDVTKKVSKKIKSTLRKVRLIIFSVKKKEKMKNFNSDLNLLIKYHLLLPINIMSLVKSYRKKIILINSDCIFDNKSNFLYASSKLLASYFVNYSRKHFPKIEVISLLLGELNSKNIKKLRKELIKILKKNKLNSKSRNILITTKTKNLYIKLK